MNLDILLDNDCLTPSQQRYVRKLMDYNLENEKGTVIVYYSPKGTSYAKRIGIKDSNFEKSVNLIYKFGLYDLVTEKVKTVSKSSPLAEEVNIIIRKDNALYVSENNLTSEAQFLFKLLERIMEAQP